MAGASREEDFDIAAEKYYAALVDYKNYPKMIAEVDSISVKNQTETSALVEYSVVVIKTFKYTLRMTQKAPTSLSWELEDGSLFKKNSGRWTITSLGANKCRVKYELDVDLKIFAPSSVTKALVAVNLPKMMQSFYAHAQTL